MFITLCNVATCVAGASDTDLTAQVDPQVTVQNSHYLLNEDMKLLAAYVMGGNVTRAKLDSPKLRALYLPFLVPVDRVTTPADEANVLDFTGFELILRAGEEIRFLASNDAGADEKNYVISFFGSGNRNVPTGPIFTMRTTATITTVADTWTLGSLTFDQTLPSGRYSIVGAMVHGTGLIAARFVLPLTNKRPGVVCAQTAGQTSTSIFRRGRMGEFGQFHNTALPSIEVLKGSAAATSVVAYLDLVRLGD
jgi:hypothetical protein